MLRARSLRLPTRVRAVAATLAAVVLGLGLLTLAPPAHAASLRGPAPVVRGWVLAGQTVTADPLARRWTPRRGVRFTYRWLLDGHPVRGARAASYRIPAAAAGRRLRVRVTAHRRGRAVRRTSAAVRVGRPAAGGPNPLAAYRWAPHRSTRDGTYPAWQAATGADKAQLAKVVAHPHVVWFTSSDSNAKVAASVRRYVGDVQQGDPDVLVQLATFRQWPRGEAGRDQPLTAAEQAAYRAWVDAVAGALGSTPVALVLEPDLGLDAPTTERLHTADPAVRLALVRYAAQVFSRLPRATVYLDASSADWLSVGKAVTLLRSAGIQYVRGFALGATHYSGVAAEISYGAQVSAALADAGMPGKRFVVDTADNGRPFTYQQYYAKHPSGFFDNAEPCTSASETRCDTLGVPPTTRVTDPRLGLDATTSAQAAALCDGYLWFGRPWLVDQASPFSLARTLQVARTTPYQ